MDLETLTSFFMWCTIINAGLFVYWVLFCLLAPDLVYRLQSKFFPVPRETWNTVTYSFLGVYKIVFLIFVLIPWLALLIIA